MTTRKPRLWRLERNGQLVNAAMLFVDALAMVLGDRHARWRLRTSWRVGEE